MVQVGFQQTGGNSNTACYTQTLADRRFECRDLGGLAQDIAAVCSSLSSGYSAEQTVMHYC